MDSARATGGTFAELSGIGEPACEVGAPQILVSSVRTARPEGPSRGPTRVDGEHVLAAKGRCERTGCRMNSRLAAENGLLPPPAGSDRKLGHLPLRRDRRSRSEGQSWPRHLRL